MDSQACACGLAYVRGHPDDEAIHRKTHEEYARGPLIPILAQLPATAVGEYRVVWVDASLPDHVRRAAARIAYVECVELQRPVSYDGSDTADKPRLVLALDGARAVGMVVLGETVTHWRLRWQASRPVVDDRARVNELRLAVGRVWIAAEYRGLGLAPAMLHHIAERCGTSPCDLVWTLPLTRGGKRLVQTLCPTEWLGDGWWSDLRETLDEES